MGSWLTFIAVFSIILLIGLFSYFVPVIHWYVASSAGLRISLAELIRWRATKLSVDAIIEALIMSKQHRLPIDKQAVLKYTREGRNVLNIVNGLIAARKHNIDLDLDQALLADSKGIPIEKAVTLLSEKRAKKDSRETKVD